MTDVDRLSDIKKRINSITQAKMTAQAELKLLKKQYEDKIGELKELGIEDVTNLPEIIKNSQIELENSFVDIETKLDKIDNELQN